MTDTAKTAETQDWRLSLVIYPDALLMPGFIGARTEILNGDPGTDQTWNTYALNIASWPRWSAGMHAHARLDVERALSLLLQRHEPLRLPGF